MKPSIDVFEIEKGFPYPLGATIINHGINFATVVRDEHRSDTGLILYIDGREHRIPFDDSFFCGNIACLFIKGIDNENLKYTYYAGDIMLSDPYARGISGREVFGNEDAKGKNVLCVIPEDEFDWEGDVPLCIPYEDSVFYGLHVRGFTRGAGSHVTKKGTFEGIIEKIPYLKSLGIRNLELMPVYEFDEWDVNNLPFAVSDDEVTYKLNFWGYKVASYFAPKASYSSDKPQISFKKLVKECHKAGIEVILQFYFPDEIKQGMILNVLRFWVIEYHVDGFHLMGNRIPLTLLATEPLFGNVKLIYYDFPYNEIYDAGEYPLFRSLASSNDNFMNDSRRFLKGDENMLSSMMAHFTTSPVKNGNIHYINNYYGFTLNDLVSYDRKHNEDNGENGRDGNDFNFSWNHGQEGPSRKNSVQKLRMKQMKNALVFEILSQGTPFLMAGSEDMNTQKGNNNAYCQDNEIGYKDWNKSKSALSMLEFTTKLLEFRGKHPVFHKVSMYRGITTEREEFPEISFHSEEAFSMNPVNYNRHMGVLYGGSFGDRKGSKDSDIYITYNMHWLPHKFALPKLPKGKEWFLVLDTSRPDSFVNEPVSDNPFTGERSIKVYESRRITDGRR